MRRRQSRLVQQLDQSHKTLVRELERQSNTLYLPTPDQSIDVKAFYELYGGFEDENTPDSTIPFEKLTPYQIHMWNDIVRDGHRFVFDIKGQRMGGSSMASLITAYMAIVRRRGQQLLLVSQDAEKAMQQLQHLADDLSRSPAFKDYLIERPPKEIRDLIKKHTTTAKIVALHNPSNMSRPTIIMAFGVNTWRQLLSHRKVGWAWLSDVAAHLAAENKAYEAYAAVRSRLVKTKGQMLIESPPSPVPSGFLFNIYDRMCNYYHTEELEYERKYQSPDWVVRNLPSQLAVKYGVLDGDVLAQEKRELAPAVYQRLYECKWFNSEMTVYSPEHSKQISTAEGDRVTDIRKLYGIDQ